MPSVELPVLTCLRLQNQFFQDSSQLLGSLMENVPAPASSVQSEDPHLKELVEELDQLFQMYCMHPVGKEVWDTLVQDADALADKVCDVGDAFVGHDEPPGKYGVMRSKRMTIGMKMVTLIMLKTTTVLSSSSSSSSGSTMMMRKWWWRDYFCLLSSSQAFVQGCGLPFAEDSAGENPSAD
eukprot:750838-Hanusia_phi.AAC.3